MSDSIPIYPPYGQRRKNTFEIRTEPPDIGGTKMSRLKRSLPSLPAEQSKASVNYSENHAFENTYEEPVNISGYEEPLHIDCNMEPVQDGKPSPYAEELSESGRRRHMERNLSRVSILEEATDIEMLGQRRFKPRNKEPVYVRVMFLKVAEIRTVEEDFKADILLQCRWREQKLDKTYKRGGKSYELQSPNSFWNPQLKIQNGVSYNENTWYQVSFDKRGFAYIYEKRRLRGRFVEQMELQEFPFDTQSLSITLQSALSQKEVVLQEDGEEVHDINIESFSDQQEWLLHKNLNSTGNEKVISRKGVKLRHSNFTVSCKATRRPTYFLWNTVMVMMLICGLMFTTFSVDLNLVQNRLQLSFILLLSTFTFKHSVNATLPKVPYLTYMDKFIFCELAIQIGVCVWHAVVFQIEVRASHETAELCDYVGLGVLGFCYIVIHVGFCITWAFTVRRTRHLLYF